MKHNNRIFALLLVCCLLLAGGTHARGELAAPMYVGAGNVMASLAINGGTAACHGNVKLSRNDYSAEIKISLQQQQENGSWRVIAAWSNSAAAGTIVSVNGTTSVPSGYKYRVTALAIIRDAGGSILEMPRATSGVIAY